MRFQRRRDLWNDVVSNGTSVSTQPFEQEPMNLPTATQKRISHDFDMDDIEMDEMDEILPLSNVGFPTRH